jgi:hypothetical protein
MIFPWSVSKGFSIASRGENLINLGQRTLRVRDVKRP